MEAAPLRKETIFEGYIVPHYEALLLEREPPVYFDPEFLGYRHMKEWFEDYIKSLLERTEDKGAADNILRRPHTSRGLPKGSAKPKNKISF